MYQSILYEKQENIAYLTLNRPQFGNAFDDDSYREIPDALEKASQDDDVRVVVLTGSGKLFCAGGDIQWMQRVIDEGTGIPESIVHSTGKLVQAIRECKKPVIASINGVAAGAGAGLAMACDFRVMEERSKIMSAFIGLAFPGDTCLMYLMAKTLGVGFTNEFMMLNKPLDGKKAHELNVANVLAPEGQLAEATQTFAKQVATLPTKAIAQQKQLVNEFIIPDYQAFNQREATTMREASFTADHKEAVDAFLNKRKPEFKNQ